MSDVLYPPSAAATAAGISKTSLRNHTGNPAYAALFSADARKVPRLFSEHDVRLLRFIGEQTTQGKTHAAIAEQIAAGALDAYEWQPPEQPTQPQRNPQQEQQAEPPQQTALVLVQQFQAVTDRLTTQLAESHLAQQTLLAALQGAERRAGQLQAEVDALRSQNAHQGRAFWRRIG